jgi:hypothetical protein
MVSRNPSFKLLSHDTETKSCAPHKRWMFLRCVIKAAQPHTLPHDDVGAGALPNSSLEAASISASPHVQFLHARFFVPASGGAQPPKLSASAADKIKRLSRSNCTPPPLAQ